MGRLKEWWKNAKEEFAFQKDYSKRILQNKWDIGAEQGKKMKEKHKKVIRRDKDES